MSAAAESRLKALDGVLDRQPASEALADELFAVVEAVGAQPSLRRALTDPSTPDEVRSQLTQSLFGDRVSGAAVAVLTEAARARWGTAGSFVAALERQGVRALLRTAQDAGRLDELEDQLEEASGGSEPIRIIAVGMGKGADMDALRRIAVVAAPLAACRLPGVRFARGHARVRRVAGRVVAVVPGATELAVRPGGGAGGGCDGLVARTPDGAEVEVT